MLLLCVAFVIPLYYLVVNSFKTQSAALVSPLAPPTAGSFTLNNYVRAFHTMHFFTDLGNSVLITSCAVVLIILFGSMAGYTLTRRQNKITEFFRTYFLFGFMIPIQTTMIPLFIIMKNLHFINTYQGMIFLHSNGCIFACFLYQGFIKTVPLELEESAFLEGCSPFQTFWRIVFPLLKPITATLVIFNVMWIWNDFMLTYLFLSSTAKSTLIMQVYNGMGQFQNDWSLMMPVLVISLLPMVIFYLAMQRNIIAGLTSGALKG